ncbi:acyltransferase [Microbacterium aureliae]
MAPLPTSPDSGFPAPRRGIRGPHHSREEGLDVNRSILQRLHLRDYWRGLILFTLFVCGRVPWHQFRLLTYRVAGVRVGRRSTIHWRTVFFEPQGITIGNHCIVGNDAFLDGRRGLSLGDNVNIGGHVQIYTLQHDPQSSSFATVGGPVVIEDRAWVASRATILPGVRIGVGAVVAAGAVVSRDVPDYSIVAGVPARQVGTRSRNLEYSLDYHLPFQ